jgi:hypothetical protein
MELNIDIDLTLAAIVAIWVVVAGFTLALCCYKPDKLDYFKKPEDEDGNLFV